MPGAHSIERYLVEDQLNLILDTYFLERKICAQQLLQIHLTSKMPLHYIIVEVWCNICYFLKFNLIFNEFLRLYLVSYLYYQKRHILSFFMVRYLLNFAD